MKYLVNGKMILTTESWEERMGEVTIEDFAKENGFTVYEDKPEQLVQEETTTALEKELKQINIWFQENDYIPNKIITGEWETTDKRWTDYLKERQTKRIRRDQIKELI